MSQVPRRGPDTETARLWRRVRLYRSKRIAIFMVPGTGRMTAVTDRARLAGSKACWQANARSFARGSSAVADAVVASTPSAASDPIANRLMP